MAEIKNRSGEIIFKDKCSLRGLVAKNKSNLSRSDLSGSDLSRINLSGSDLSRINLSGSDLSGSDLSGSNLSWSDLSWSDLSRINLSWSDLSGSILSGSNLEFWQFPSIRLLSSLQLKNISNETILELMRLDADAHPNPQAFDIWSNGGPCPYQNEERWWYLPTKRGIWKPGKPTMKLSDLIIQICKEEKWGIKGYLEIERQV